MRANVAASLCMDMIVLRTLFSGTKSDRGFTTREKLWRNNRRYEERHALRGCQNRSATTQESNVPYRRDTCYHPFRATSKRSYININYYHVRYQYVARGYQSHAFAEYVLFHKKQPRYLRVLVPLRLLVFVVKCFERDVFGQ